MSTSNNTGVIINVYTESTILKSNKQNDSITKIMIPKISSKSRVFETRGRRGYNRRAQLLAYVHKLRHANNEELGQCPFNNSRRKTKKWRWLLPVQKMRVCLSSRFYGIKRRWNKYYEPIVTEEYRDDGEEGSCNVNQETRKPKIYSHFCKKLQCFIKEISRTCQCKNGGC